MRALRSTFIALGILVLPAAPLTAQEGGFSLNAQVGIPQGEFAKNVAAAGGFGFGLVFPVASEFGIRAGFDLQVYGIRTRRLVIPAGPAGSFNAEIKTTNAIVGASIGAQIGLPSERAKPYLGGLLGFSNFNTRSSASGEDSDAEPFASNINASDYVFSKHAIAGIYYPLADGNVLFDLGARYTWNGESARYLTRGDISEDAFGNVLFNVRESPADLFTVTLGVTIRFSEMKRLPR